MTVPLQQVDENHRTLARHQLLSIYITPWNGNILGERRELARTGPRMIRPIGMMSAVQLCSSVYAGIGVVHDNKGSIWPTWVRYQTNEQDP